MALHALRWAQHHFLNAVINSHVLPWNLDLFCDQGRTRLKAIKGQKNHLRGHLQVNSLDRHFSKHKDRAVSWVDEYCNADIHSRFINSQPKPSSHCVSIVVYLVWLFWACLHSAACPRVPSTRILKLSNTEKCARVFNLILSVVLSDSTPYQTCRNCLGFMDINLWKRCTKLAVANFIPFCWHSKKMQMLTRSCSARTLKLKHMYFTFFLIIIHSSSFSINWMFENHFLFCHL